jgi:putative two-component system response regulator
MKKTIFVVDDNDTNLSMANEALKDQYRVLTLPSAAKMFALMEKVTPDLILLDIRMPEIDGFEALRRLKGNDLYAGIPVVLLTGLTDASTETQGLELGAVDFVTKPFSASVLLNRIKNQLNIDELIRERTARIEHLQNGIILVLADIVESRDRDTGGHTERVAEYLRILIDAMLSRGIYAEEMRNWDLERVVSSARLHDVGKIIISDAILNKPGYLTEAEFEEIKTHVTKGEEIIDQIVARTGEMEFLRNAKLFAGYHHENWNGTGYPYGLSGMDIPLHGRIMAVADVYDALVSERPYKKAFTSEEAVSIITADAGKRFDPKIVEVFCAVQAQVGE